MYLLTCVFCYFFSFLPIPEFFFFPWSGISLPTDCTVLLLPVVAWNKTIKTFPFQTKPNKNPTNTNQTKNHKPCSSETNLPFNINHLENFIIHQPISPFPAGTLPFLVVDDLCNLALPFDSLPLPCPSAALLCCSLKRVTPQCLFILFGMLLFTLFITLFFFHLVEIYFFLLILQKCTVCSLLYFRFWMHNFYLFLFVLHCFT